MRKLFILALLFILVFTTFGYGELKIGVIYLGTTNDAGWNYAHKRGFLSLKKQYGNKINITEIEDVGGNAADIYTALDNLIGLGNKLIFATAWDFMNPTIETAKKHPDIVFEHCSGYKRADNVGTYFVRMYNMDYLAGIVAGLKTTNNKIGMVLPHAIPEVVRQANAFALGVFRVNPNAKVKILWTNSWYDPAKESEYARALIEWGATVLAHGCDSPSVVATAEKLGVWVIGYGNDQSKYAPTKWLTAPVWNWQVVYKSIVEDVLNNNWKSKAIWDKYGAVLSPVRIKSSILVSAMKEIFEHDYNIFTGELIDNKGRVIAKQGESLSDNDIWNMYWLNHNIIGTLP